MAGFLRFVISGVTFGVQPCATTNGYTTHHHTMAPRWHLCMTHQALVGDEALQASGGSTGLKPERVKDDVI